MFSQMKNRSQQHPLPILSQKIVQHPKYTNPRTRPKDLRYNPNYNNSNNEKNKQTNRIILALVSIDGPFCKFLLQQPNIRKSLVQCKQKVSCTCQQFIDDSSKRCKHIQFVFDQVIGRAQKNFVQKKIQSIKNRNKIRFEQMSSSLTFSVENSLRLRRQIRKKNEYSLHRFFFSFQQNQVMEKCFKICQICLFPVEDIIMKPYPQYLKQREMKQSKNNQNPQICYNCCMQFHSWCYKKWLEFKWRNQCPVCLSTLKNMNKYEYRIVKGLKQRMFLIGFNVYIRQSSFLNRKVQYNEKNEQPFGTVQQWDFLIVDSSLYREYKITVNYWNIKCSCLDNERNFVSCKHILFLSVKLSNKRRQLEIRLNHYNYPQLDSFCKGDDLILMSSLSVKKLISGFKRRLKFLIDCKHSKHSKQSKNEQFMAKQQQSCTQEFQIQQQHLTKPFQLCLICFEVIINSQQIHPEQYQNCMDASFITKQNCINGDQCFHQNCLQIWRYKISEKFKYEIKHQKQQKCPYCYKQSYQVYGMQVFQSKQSLLDLQQHQLQFDFASINLVKKEQQKT